MIKLESISSHLPAQIGCLVKYRLQLRFAKSIRVNVHDSLIGVFCRLFKEVFIAANNCFWPQFDVEVPEIIVFEANAVLACGGVRFVLVTLDDKDRFIYVLSLLKYVVRIPDQQNYDRPSM